MDTFGRLPSDVLKYICMIYATHIAPVFELIPMNNYGEHQLVVTSPFFQHVYMFENYSSYTLGNINEIDQFILHPHRLVLYGNVRFRVNVEKESFNIIYGLNES